VQLDYLLQVSFIEGVCSGTKSRSSRNYLEIGPSCDPGRVEQEVRRLSYTTRVVRSENNFHLGGFGDAATGFTANELNLVLPRVEPLDMLTKPVLWIGRLDVKNRVSGDRPGVCPHARLTSRLSECWSAFE